VVVTAGSVSGTLSRDLSSANHPLTNSFNAQKMQNDLRIQQVGSQVVGEVGGVISDALNNAGISGFGTTDVGNAWGRIGLETAGSALVAGLSGGNIGATAAGTAAGDAAAIAMREWAGSVAQAITTDGNAQRVIENMLSNAIGASAGAAGGAAAGGSGHTMLNALAGAGYASAIQQFNQANENDEKEANKGSRNTREALDWVLGPSPREVTEEFREQTYDTDAHELARLDPSNPELQTLTDPNQPRVISDNDVSRMENALLEAREVNRLLTTPEGRKELLAKTPTGTENLTEAAKKSC
jgi:hypothetical protein